MKKKGFTLIEMVLVMTVVVILFLLTVPNVSKTMNIVNTKGCDAQTKVIDAALIQFKLLNDRDATSLGELVNEGLITERQTRCNDGSEILIVEGQARQ